MGRISKNKYLEKNYEIENVYGMAINTFMSL